MEKGKPTNSEFIASDRRYDLDLENKNRIRQPFSF